MDNGTILVNEYRGPWHIKRATKAKVSWHMAVSDAHRTRQSEVLIR